MSEIERWYHGDDKGLHDLGVEFEHTKQALFEFSSPEVCAQVIEREGKGGLWDDTAWDNDSYGNWQGTKSMPEALSLARLGWQEGASAAKRAMELIKPAVPTQKRHVKFAVAGALPDIPRYLAGDPMHMRNIASIRARQRPAITFISNGAAVAVTNERELLNRAAVCAAIVDATEEQGFSCEVITVSATTNQDTVGSLAIKIKEAGSALDLARFAFGIGHPSVFRRFAFHFFGGRRECRPLGHHMGYPRNVKMTAVPGTFKLLGVEEARGMFSTPEIARDKGLPVLLESLRSQGCPAFPSEEVAA